jgi:hypothetical protein
MARKSHEELEKELIEAKKEIKVGGVYKHFKNADSRYKVVSLAFTESDEKLAVVYQNIKEPNLVFIKPFDTWFDEKDFEGKIVRRFEEV